MSSIPQPGPEALITVKVTYENTLRRVKMPLRDMVPHTLEDNIRLFLRISPEDQIIIERYSDSAGSFVVLDPINVPIYKQLYRAAKAKSKLKLRVSTLQTQPKTTPKPATVEDEPEESVAETYETTDKTTPFESDESASTNEPATDMSMPFEAPSSSATLLSGIDLPLRTASSTQLDTAETARAEEETEAPVAQKLSAVFTAPPMDSAPLHPVITAAPFAVCCNNCEKTVSDVHYHCQTCDDGDFDLCQNCVDEGVSCYDDNHWLIKRTMIDGQLIASLTEKIEPKSQLKKHIEGLYKAASVLPSIETPEKEETEALKAARLDKAPAFFTAQPTPEERNTAPANAFTPHTVPFVGGAITRWSSLSNMRTCNCCVQELPEAEFLHCTTCEDYDLCHACFGKDAHGHHPKHSFAPAVTGSRIPDHIAIKMKAGRNQAHNAICDGCDKYITGVRHKCLDCPDWDYCDTCVLSAAVTHMSHRFVPIYEPLADAAAVAQPVHMGICCDGPLCSKNQGYPTYIRGVRYKCAVCHDLDFCASCEANPANEHNKTHPLIKFKTPVRHVSVTTTGEHQDGKRMPPMGDRARNVPKASETSTLSDSNTINRVQTVVDVKPEEPKVEEAQVADVAAPVDENDLRAVFLRDSVTDGTIMPPNHVFEQTWVLRNEGTTTWPAGCSVKFVGGDYMGHVDSAHPAGISELVSASESTVCYAPLAPGNEFPFTVLLRTPARAGQIISYWRLTTPSGFKFGHRLWCDVSVRMPPAEAPAAPAVEEPKKEEDTQTDSVMIFPKLDKESPQASMHEEHQAESVAGTAAETDALTASGEEYEWDGSDDGFLTDEEYDILDASDEEYLTDRDSKRLRK
ncbi:hypothetical protein BBK36DRAFT_1178535 [Trichoderma citrinoviride]|uniref:ZZ-type domain-containing protein n=1 Tax=Trichoderma citrinoviride TaxID=58853 RepID=A0A2T4B4D9_9HYPO|nr:hypothetical protein BBK36DRAFT_1178535 [Trichoderma citrinoviride]PTB64185.1 hypothetical protein BBK36DRAFT_1178535 [Trichoderma citrinoviride]